MYHTPIFQNLSEKFALYAYRGLRATRHWSRWFAMKDIDSMSSRPRDAKDRDSVASWSRDGTQSPAFRTHRFMSATPISSFGYPRVATHSNTACGWSVALMHRARTSAKN